MSGGESGRETLREDHGEAVGKADGRNKGESDRGFVTGVKEDGNRAESSHKSLKISFRDKVVGASEPKKFVLDDDLDGDTLAVVQERQGDSPPRITFTDE
ncbi:hypothetical protein PIB30_047686 [Stylosanthes scabra]|uniref:Uncharacterized protein n=1 Tax=Stylosanthes scabra TaxID=79078 RepID=A0ABU6ZFJ9_9FABA|nr:hypothetical protein [Stylosanthes scabra]